MKMLAQFIVDVDEGDEFDFDDIREQIGNGTAELYQLSDAEWAEEVRP